MKLLFSILLVLALGLPAKAQTVAHTINGSSMVSGYTADISDTTSTQVIAANANNRIYLTHIAVTNSNASTGTVVKILDGSTVKYRFNVPAGSGASIILTVPLRGTKNTAWMCQPESSATVQCSFSGYLYAN